MEQSLASRPAALRERRLSGSVVLAGVSFARFWPRKSAPSPSLSFIVAAVLGPKALLRRPGLDQSPIHRKMLVRQKRLHLRVIQKLRHELLKHLAVLQSIPVLGESRRVPHRVVRRKPGEPAIQKIIVELFHQLAFRAKAVQLLRWDRGAARARIELSEAGAQVFQNRLNQEPSHVYPSLVSHVISMGLQFQHIAPLFAWSRRYQ